MRRRTFARPSENRPYQIRLQRWEQVNYKGFVVLPPTWAVNSARAAMRT